MDRRMTHSEATRLARKLLDEHGLSDWSFKLDNAKRRAGSCSWSRKTISLSKYLMAQRAYENSLNTITHEVAHALTPGHGHDAVWAAKHRELGGNGKRCFDDHYDKQSPIVGRCPHGEEVARYRMPKRPDAWVCRCRPSSGKIVWERRVAV